MSRDRPPSFQFYPRDLLTSRAVLLMSPEARGGYLFLLCHAWDSDRPGVLPADDSTLASLSGLGDRWAACRDQIAAAFDTRSKGVWLQTRMISERKAQRRRYQQARKGASATNAVRWGSVAQRHDSESLSRRTAVTPASSSSSSLTTTPPPSASRIATPNRAREGQPDRGAEPGGGRLATRTGEPTANHTATTADKDRP